MRLLFQSVMFAAMALAAGGAFAADAAPGDECALPCLEYSGSIDLSAEWIRSTDPDIPNYLVIAPSIENHYVFRPVEGLSFISNFVTEQVADDEPGADQIFAGIGSYADILQAQYDFENVSVWGGKIHPAFGRAWDVTPGLNGTNLAEGYELAERLGGGASISFEAAGFANTLQASAFTTDRTFLSDSVFTRRGRLRLGDGGAGNEKGVSSFAAALDGCMGAEPGDCYDEGDFGYQIAARWQKGGHGSEGNELGLAGSLNTSFSVGEESKLKLFGETAWFRNFDGSADNALIVTGSGALDIGQTTLSLAYTRQRNFIVDDVDTTAHLFDATAAYAFGEDVSLAGEAWSIAAGYTFERDDDVDTHTFSLQLSTEFDGKFALGN
jgi:hypothetical protein